MSCSDKANKNRPMLAQTTAKLGNVTFHINIGIFSGGEPCGPCAEGQETVSSPKPCPETGDDYWDPLEQMADCTSCASTADLVLGRWDESIPVFASGFGFTGTQIVANSTIDRVRVAIVSYAATSGRIKTGSFVLVRPASPIPEYSEDKSSVQGCCQHWSSCGEWSVFEGTAAEWGLSGLTREDVINSNFGVKFHAENTFTTEGSPGNDILSKVDCIKMKVWWTPPGQSQTSDEKEATGFSHIE